MAGPPDRTAAAGRPAALLMRVLGARLRYQATRKGGTNKGLRPAATRAVHRPGEGGPGRGGRPHELAPGRHLSGLRGQHLVGILTERDLTAAIGQGADPATTRCRTRLPRLRRFPGPTANSPRVRWAGTAAVSTPPGGSTGCCSAKLAQRHPAGSRPTTAAGGRGWYPRRPPRRRLVSGWGRCT